MKLIELKMNVKEPVSREDIDVVRVSDVRLALQKLRYRYWNNRLDLTFDEIVDDVFGSNSEYEETGDYIEL